MKISVNDQELYSLNETKKSVIKDHVHEDIFDADMKRRLEWVLTHLYEQCFDRLKKEWEPKLVAAGAKSIPTDKDEFAQMVFAHPEYKSRKVRDSQDVGRGNHR